MEREVVGLLIDLVDQLADALHGEMGGQDGRGDEGDALGKPGDDLGVFVVDTDGIGETVVHDVLLGDDRLSIAEQGGHEKHRDDGTQAQFDADRCTIVGETTHDRNPMVGCSSWYYISEFFLNRTFKGIATLQEILPPSTDVDGGSPCHQMILFIALATANVAITIPTEMIAVAAALFFELFITPPKVSFPHPPERLKTRM